MRRSANEKTLGIRAVSCALIISLSLLFSCSDETEKNPDGTDSPDAAEITTTFRPELITLPDGFGMSSAELSAAGGKLCIGGWSQAETRADQRRQLLMLDDATREAELQTFEAKGEDTFIGSIAYSDSGEKYVVEAALSDLSFESMTVLRYSADGKLIADYDCAELFGLDISKLKADVSGAGGFIIRAVGDFGGGIAIVSNTGVAAIKADGTTELIESRKELTDASIIDGERIIVMYENGASKAAAYAGFTAGEIGSAIKLPDSGTFKPFPLAGYELGAAYTDGIYGISRNEDGSFQSTLLCDFNASDMSGEINGIAAISPQCFYVTERSMTDYRSVLYRLEMVKKSELTEKQTLVIASVLGMDYYMRGAVTEFNRTSDTVHIEVNEYALDTVDDTLDTTTALTRFNADIASGNVPDIVMLTTAFGADAGMYADKGLFCDLYSLIDADHEYKRENLLECVRASSERVDAKTKKTVLPYLPVKSHVAVLLGRESDFGGRLTLSGALDIIDSPDGGVLFSNLSQNTIINSLLIHDLEEFIDYSTRKTKFTDDLFLRVCELYRRAANGEFLSGYIDSKEGFRTGAVLTYEIQNYTPISLINTEIKTGVDDIAIIGYPDSDGSGTVLSSDYVYGITEQCKNKQAAWEFLKIRISDDYCIAASVNECPIVTESALNKYFDKLPRYYYVSYERGYMATNAPVDENDAKLMVGDGVSVELDGEALAKAREIVISARAEPQINDKILGIISEELSSFASKPEITAAEAARIIDGRVAILYNEQMK